MISELEMMSTPPRPTFKIALWTDKLCACPFGVMRTNSDGSRYWHATHLTPDRVVPLFMELGLWSKG